MMIGRKLWFSLLLHGFVASVNAQDLNKGFFPVAINELSGKSVSCALQDHRGFMWFGTSEGLARFDGTSVKIYKHNNHDGQSLSHSEVNVLLEDADHNLWVGTSNGLNRYDPTHDTFVNIDSILPDQTALSNHFITALACDQLGQIWIGTYGGGIDIYNTGNSSLESRFSDNNKDHYSGASFIHGIVIRDFQAWIATRAGVKVIDIRSHQSQKHEENESNIPGCEVTAIAKGEDDNLLLGFTDGEIYQIGFGEKKKVIKRYYNIRSLTGSAPIVRSISVDRSGDLWIVTEKSGLIRFNPALHQSTVFQPEEGNPNSLPAYSLRMVYNDRDGRVWVGTYNIGVHVMDPHVRKFELYRRNALRGPEALLDNNVRSFAEDKSGNIWIASNGGVNTLDMQTRQLASPERINRLVRGKVIKEVMIDSENQLWIGTRDDGVVRVNLKTFESRSFELKSTGIGNNKVLCLYEDREQNVWAGTLGSGLFRFDKGAGVFRSLAEIDDSKDQVPARAYVTSIIEDSHHSLWIGTLDGLFVVQRRKNNALSYRSYYQHHSKSNLSSSRITELFEDKSGAVWVGTFDNGLNKYVREEDRFENYSEENGLVNNSIKGVMEDGRGNLWISSNAGISRFNLSDKSVNHYSKDAGLNSDFFHPGSCLETASGDFIYGGDNGFNIFSPDSVKDDLEAPLMYLTAFRVNNRPVTIGKNESPLSRHISLTKKMSLSYAQRSFAIDFVALGFGSSARNQYCYKLEGFEDAWNCIGSDQTATYTNIDPGHYIFVVKGANSDGVWSAEPARLEITVHPPVWNTWWANLIYVVVFLGVMYLAVRIKTERATIKNQLKLEKLAREKEHELTLKKMHFFTNISHELRTPLTLILMPLEKIVNSPTVPAKLRASLSTAYMNCAKLVKLVNELMDLSKFEEVTPTLSVQQGEVVRFITEIAATFNDVAEKKEIRVSFLTSPPEIHGWYDHDKLEKILRNLLSNAFKFTPEKGEIKVTINTTEVTGVTGTITHLEVKVTDNGIGIKPQELHMIFNKFFQAPSNSNIPHAGTGIGLALTKTLVEVHRGTIAVESLHGKGTTFTIRIPVDRNAFHQDELQNIPDIVHDGVVPETDEYNDVVLDQGLGKAELLIVEDNDELRQFLVAEFNEDFSVSEAADGNDGFHLACEKIPDLIVSDIVLPGQTGLTLCQEIKSDLRTSHIPVILLTAKTSTEDQVAGLECGADIYMPKPFSLRVLRAHVKQIIHARKKLYARYSQEAFLLPESLTENVLDKEFLQKAVDYIEANLLNTQLSVESIAELFNISRSQVYRKIKAITGQTVVEFIRTIRLKHALKLMDQRKFTLSEVAYQTGFNSLSYFTRSFKDQYGKTPSEFAAGRKE